jgi:hypothetical protein
MGGGFRLRARCPKCNREPTDRYTASAVAAARLQPPGDEMKNVRCRCGVTYRVAWASLADARPARSEEGNPWAA